MMHVAKCLCGQIAFEVSAIGTRIAHCHCTMCQKFHGAAFSTYVEAKLHHINWLKGQELLVQYTAVNQTTRQFCQCCGSSISFESKYNRIDSTLELALALFEQPEKLLNSSNVKPDCHIYVESKAPWFDINDQLKQCQRYRE